MISIGVITRGKYGQRFIENLKKDKGLRVQSLRIPETLPDFIEDPGDFIARLNLDSDIFSSDIIAGYILHPDLTSEIIRLAGDFGAKAVIIAGGIAKAGSFDDLLRLSKKYKMHIEVHEICCDIEKSGNSLVDKIASSFGKPIIRATTKNGIIKDVEVIRGAPCGSTWHMAEGLKGTRIEDAPSRAGLLVQQYPCRAIRGIKGGIHKAAQLHKKAVEKALGED